MGADYKGLNPFLQDNDSLLNQANFVLPSNDPSIAGLGQNDLYSAPDPLSQDAKYDTSGLAVTWTGITGGTAFLGKTANRDGALIVRNSVGGTSLFMGNPTETNPLSGTTGFSIASTQKISASQFVDASSNSFYLDPAATGTSLVTAGSAFFGGKVTATAFDPVYEIQDKCYATYAPSIIGIKEEISFTHFVKETFYIDFDSLEEGSDLWIFSQITDLGENLKNLVVLLTPSRHGVTPFYSKIDRVLGISVNPYFAESEVSIRLTAPRFDNDEYKTKLDEKYKMALKPKRSTLT